MQDALGFLHTTVFAAARQQITQQNFLGVRTYGYDLNGRQTSVAYPTRLILTYAFDVVSNRTSLLDPAAAKAMFDCLNTDKKKKWGECKKFNPTMVHVVITPRKGCLAIQGKPCL